MLAWLKTSFSSIYFDQERCKGCFIVYKIAISVLWTFASPSSPKTDRIQIIFSNLFGIIRSRNNQIWPPPSSIICSKFHSIYECFHKKWLGNFTNKNLYRTNILGYCSLFGLLRIFYNAAKTRIARVKKGKSNQNLKN